MPSMSASPSHLPASALIVGCGDVGLRIARRLIALGIRPIGLVRRAEAARWLLAQGIAPCLADLDGETPAELPAAGWVFWCAPPPGQGVSDTRLRRHLPQLEGRRVVYGSTTGVYGDCGGRWITEDEPTMPLHDRGRRRLDAENALRQAGLDAVILRIPGIYGPGRWPLERLHAGTPVIDPAEAPPSNRIHAEDLAEAAVLAARRGHSGRVYHVADGSPTSMTDYFWRVAERFGLPRPPAIPLAEARQVFTPMQWSFIEGAKRLAIDRARRELGFDPVYKSLSQALAAAA
jgi:nucleoside-diphosphate-sugar epimerase